MSANYANSLMMQGPEQSYFSPLCQPGRSLTRVRVKTRPPYASDSSQTLSSDFCRLNLSNGIEALLHRR